MYVGELEEYSSVTLTLAASHPWFFGTWGYSHGIQCTGWSVWPTATPDAVGGESTL